MNEKMKKVLISIGIVVVLIIFIVLAVIIYVANEKVVYGQNYYNNDGSVYFSLNNDGTCETKNAISCNYSINGDVLHWNAVWNYYGTEFEYKVDFEIVDKKTLQSKVAEVNGIEAEFESLWVAGRKEFKTTTEASKPYYQTYNILTLNSGKKATITFSKDGVCDVDFSQFNNSNLGNGKSGTSKDYISVTYNSGTCTYEVIDDKNLIINYTGIVEMKYHWYMDYYKQMQTSLMGSYYTLKDAAITFEDNYAKIKFTNGKFVGQTGEVFYYYYKVDEGAKTPTTTKKVADTTDNDSESSTKTTKKNEITSKVTTKEGKTTETTTKTTTTKLITPTTEEVKNVNTISVDLRDRNGLYYCVYLRSNGDYDARMDDYIVSIKGETFDANTDFPAACYKYIKEGNHCLDITVYDSNKNKKDFNNKCIKFTPEKLNYEATVSSGYGGYYIRLFDNSDTSRNNNDHYNNANNITVYLDGKKVSSTFYVGVVFNDCKHTIKVENKFGKSQTINLTC